MWSIISISAGWSVFRVDSPVSTNSLGDRRAERFGFAMVRFALRGDRELFVLPAFLDLFPGGHAQVGDRWGGGVGASRDLR